MNLDSRSRRGPQPLRARLRQAVADAIIAAAEEVMAERGVHSASMGEIAARAGVAVGTLYNHFADRHALVQALFRARREELTPRLRQLAGREADRPFDQRLRAYVRDLLALFDEHRAFVRVALDAPLRAAERPAGPRPVMAQLLHGFTELLRAGIEAGMVAPIPIELHALLLVSMVRAVIQHALAENRPFAPDADAVTDLFLRGVSAST